MNLFKKFNLHIISSVEVIQTEIKEAKAVVAAFVSLILSIIIRARIIFMISCLMIIFLIVGR